ncbi:F-box/WD WD repeat-containing 11-like isoform X3 [Octopus vulgaris]|uniref:F-box/WD WD repeat-containing 11-like isoform X3 n=2 Tax=Octopus TaxID=6643 RepID=A0AA36F5P4_OCTVU|nr:uncharacterized protein LOC115213953 [Octopus sinensis]CAI9725422.1 F-box/WD WD repeat-containing 11-like isoform X3 [Octopus vulgaris]
MTELSDIPEEVLRIIFRKLDGTTLFRMGQVCKYWYRIVYELTQDVSMWCSFCLYEIPTPALEQMTGLVDVDNLLECDSRMRDKILSVRLPWQYWREVYIAYCRSRCLRQWHCLRRTVKQSKFRGKPTCVKFHGNLLLTGHENGSVICWENAGMKHQTNSLLHRHRSAVTALAVLDFSNLKNGKTTSFTIISGSDDRELLYTTYRSEHRMTRCLSHSTIVTSISSWGSNFVTGNQDTILHGQWVFTLTPDFNIVRRFHLLGHGSSNITATCLWKNKVASGDDEGNIYIWELTETHKRYLLPFNVLSSSGPVQQIILCGDRLLCLSGKHTLSVYSNDKCCVEKNIFHDLTRTPEYISLWGPILAVGVKAGIVYIYRLETDKDWINIDLTAPLYILHSGQEHVLSLDITDSGLGPSLAFATDNNTIHLAHWLPQHSKRVR